MPGNFRFMVDFVDHKDLHISHGYETIDGDCQDSNDIQQCISPFINSRHFTVHYMSHVVNYRVLSHDLRLHSNMGLKVLPQKR